MYPTDPWTPTDQLSVTALRAVAEQAAAAQAHYSAGGYFAVGPTGSIAASEQRRYSAFGYVTTDIPPARAVYYGVGRVEVWRMAAPASDYEFELGLYSGGMEARPTGEIVFAVNPTAQYIAAGTMVHLLLDETSNCYVVQQIALANAVCDMLDPPGDLMAALFSGGAYETWGRVQLVGLAVSQFPRRWEAWAPEVYTLADGTTVRLKIALTFASSYPRDPRVRLFGSGDNLDVPLLFFYAYRLSDNSYVGPVSGGAYGRLEQCASDILEFPTLPPLGVLGVSGDSGQCTIVDGAWASIVPAGCPSQRYPSALRVTLASPTWDAIRGTYRIGVAAAGPGTSTWFDTFIVSGQVLSLSLSSSAARSESTRFEFRADYGFWHESTYFPCADLPLSIQLPHESGPLYVTIDDPF